MAVVGHYTTLDFDFFLLVKLDFDPDSFALVLVPN